MKFLEEYEFWCHSCGKRQSCPTFRYYFLPLPETPEGATEIRLCRNCGTRFRAGRMRELEVCREIKQAQKERQRNRSLGH